jgi:hypothetical protein
MKKLTLVIFMSFLFCNISFANIYYLKCKYDDGSGDEKFKINLNSNKVIWSDDSNEEAFRIIRYNGNNHTIRAFITDKISVKELGEDGKKPKGDMKVYNFSLRSLDIELFYIINKISNKATIVHYTEYGQKLFVDEKYKERIHLPSEEDIQKSTRGKNILNKNSIIQDQAFGGAAILNCTSY